MSPLRGGPSFALAGLAEALREKDLIVDIATTDSPSDDAMTRGRRTNGSLLEFGRQLQFYSVSLPLAWWLALHVRNYDVVHIHSLFSFPALAASLSARIFGVPYVIRPLGTLCRWGRQNRRPLLKRLSFRILERRILEEAAAVHYTSEQEKIEAADLGVTRPAWLLPNPVDPPAVYRSLKRGNFRARYPQLGQRPIVLFLSRLHPVKGLDLLLEAFARVRQQCADAALVIAGEGEPSFEMDLRKQAERLELDDHVLWTGFLAGEEKWSALADADVFVLPSYSENFGVAAVEAMCAGAPVIVSNRVGIHPEMERADAGRVVSCDAGKLAEAILQLLGDAGLCARLRTNAKNLAEHEFSAAAVVAGLMSGYHNLLRPRTTPAGTPAAELTES